MNGGHIIGSVEGQEGVFISPSFNSHQLQPIFCKSNFFTSSAVSSRSTFLPPYLQLRQALSVEPLKLPHSGHFQTSEPMSSSLLFYGIIHVKSNIGNWYSQPSEISARPKVGENKWIKLTAHIEQCLSKGSLKDQQVVHFQALCTGVVALCTGNKMIHKQ